MGCSPSKGKLFSKPEHPGRPSAPPTEAVQHANDSGRLKEESKCLTTDKENELLPPVEHPVKETETHAPSSEDVNEAEVNATTQKANHEANHVGSVRIKKMEKRKKVKGKRKPSEKHRSSGGHVKVDFPPHMVRAHQAAYAFLNPNISKYETLLGLLDQAAQTQLSLQPMMSALVLRFEEINQALEEMAEEGELMLKGHGDYMALPSGMLVPAVLQVVAPCITTASSPDPPPDLLQQLLQHSTEKMRLVGGSVQALGDTTLEEAAEYFSSLSKLLTEKLHAKQAVELRLAQVLARVEGAAMRKPNPEDSALHSEDSGIGGENESLTGSERHRHHRGSAGSGSCGTLSNPTHPLIHKSVNYLQEQQPILKRPLTAAMATKSEHPPSRRCANIVIELQNSQKALDLRIKKMIESQGHKGLAGPHYNLYRAGLRRHSLSSSVGAQRGPLRGNQSPFSAPQPPKRPSVKRLINTFSQGFDGRPSGVPPHIRRPRKGGVLANGHEGGLVINGNNNNNSWPDSRDELDVDNLPPPPPEVLMDDSFQSTEVTGGGEGRSHEDSVRLPPIIQSSGVSQRLRASVQNVEVLPSRASVKPKSVTILPNRPVRQDAVMAGQDAEQQPESDSDPEKEKANSLYQQARKIIHLRDAADSSDKRASQSRDCYEAEASSGTVSVTVPPVSRVRLPPSCPSVCHRFPSPPAYRPQTTSRASSRPGSPRTVKCSREKETEEIIPSVSFNEARSVFCQKEHDSGSPVLPRPWGEACRGRVSRRSADNSGRRTQSEQRPATTSHADFFKDDIPTSSHQPQEREPGATKNRLDDPVMKGDDTQLDPSATETTA
ncbi:uncharacterized protein V6R79_020282 [Siganus canaliculatus]